MIRMHASTKSIVVDGAIHFLPMITARGAMGRMIGSKVPQGAAREFRTFTTDAAARACAQAMVDKCAAQYPALLIAA